MASPTSVLLPDGRSLAVHDSDDPAGGAALTIVWHNGSPHTGALLEPVVAAAATRLIRVISYARPSYDGSSPRPGRTVADGAADVLAIADALGLDRFAVMGASGGGPHALACAALLPERVIAAATFACIAPDAPDLDWLAGMQSPGALSAAREGREARARFAETDEFDAAQFVASDWAALAGDWSAVGADATAAEGNGPDGLVDDDLAFASPWGFDPASIVAPVLLVQGTADRVVPRAHGEWLAAHLPNAELLLLEDDGHVAVLRAVPDAMDWLLSRAQDG